MGKRGHGTRCPCGPQTYLIGISKNVFEQYRDLEKNTFDTSVKLFSVENSIGVKQYQENVGEDVKLLRFGVPNENRQTDGSTPCPLAIGRPPGPRRRSGGGRGGRPTLRGGGPSAGTRGAPGGTPPPPEPLVQPPIPFLGGKTNRGWGRQLPQVSGDPKIGAQKRLNPSGPYPVPPLTLWD